QRFRQSDATWLLVSDESGGEGRNFQFAAGIVHYDTPWYVSRVEQRIGRLDRLGREATSPEVLSVVLFNEASTEAGLVRVYDAAVQVYDHSVSGLEFALRDVERQVTAMALSCGLAALTDGTAELAEIVQPERQPADAVDVTE